MRNISALTVNVLTSVSSFHLCCECDAFQCHQVCVHCLMGNVVLMKVYCSAGRKNNVTQCVQGGVSVCSVVFGGLMVET